MQRMLMRYTGSEHFDLYPGSRMHEKCLEAMKAFLLERVPV